MNDFLADKALTIAAAITCVLIIAFMALGLVHVTHEVIRDWNCPACADKCEARK